MADDAEEMLSSLQSDSCTCLLWCGCQFQVAQHTSAAMLLEQSFVIDCLSLSDKIPAPDIHGAAIVMQETSLFSRGSETTNDHLVFFFSQLVISDTALTCINSLVKHTQLARVQEVSKTSCLSKLATE